MSSDAPLEHLIARLRELPGVSERAAPDVAEAVQDELERTLAAGTTPEGEQWRPTLEGGRPLVRAAQALRVAAVGTRIVVRIRGVEARHSLGRARGGVERRMLPSGPVPPAMAARVREVLAEALRSTLGGR